MEMRKNEENSIKIMAIIRNKRPSNLRDDRNTKFFSEIKMF